MEPVGLNRVLQGYIRVPPIEGPNIPQIQPTPGVLCTQCGKDFGESGLFG